jgi:hypothetical protein
MWKNCSPSATFVDHVRIYRWVQRFTPEMIDAARPSRHLAGDRWFVDETYLKVAGRWVYLYRAIDQHGTLAAVDLLPGVAAAGVAADGVGTFHALRVDQPCGVPEVGLTV